MPELDILRTLVVSLGSCTLLFVGQHGRYDGKPVETCHASNRTYDSPWFRFKTNMQVDFFVRFISGKKLMESLYRYRDTRPMTCGMGVGAIRRIRIFFIYANTLCHTHVRNHWSTTDDAGTSDSPVLYPNHGNYSTYEFRSPFFLLFHFHY